MIKVGHAGIANSERLANDFHDTCPRVLLELDFSFR